MPKQDDEVVDNPTSHLVYRKPTLRYRQKPTVKVLRLTKVREGVFNSKIEELKGVVDKNELISQYRKLYWSLKG